MRFPMPLGFGSLGSAWGRWLRVGVMTLGLLLGGATRARAVDLTIQLDSTAQSYARAVGLDVGQLQLQLQNALREYFQLNRLEDFLQEFGDGQSFTNRGLGVDYASDFNWFIVGASANVAANDPAKFYGVVTDSRATTEQLMSYGRGLNVTVMAGLNFDFLGLPIVGYTNYFVFKYNYGPFEGRNTNFGLHLQLNLYRPNWTGVVDKLFHWGGIDITTGVEQEKGLLWLSGVASTEVPVSQASATSPAGLVRADATGDISFYTRAVTVPIELTTNLRLFHLLSLYGGAGYDIKVASAVNAYMAANARLTGRLQGSRETQALGAARVEISQQSRLSAGDFRVLGGVQLNLFLIKLFAHLNLLFHDPVLITAGAGLRLAY
jgi:hypothetical protein